MAFLSQLLLRFGGAKKGRGVERRKFRRKRTGRSKERKRLRKEKRTKKRKRIQKEKPWFLLWSDRPSFITSQKECWSSFTVGNCFPKLLNRGIPTLALEGVKRKKEEEKKKKGSEGKPQITRTKPFSVWTNPDNAEV